MSRIACLIALASCLSVGCTADIPYDSTSSPIVDGVAENGYESVVFLFNRAGGACSAALVAPRAVLTARHCVESRGGVAQPRDLTVYVGPVAFRPGRL